MHWLVHVGTEKTGSSHLQSLAALAREPLAAQGVAFAPGRAHDERRMRTGRISAGNARRLAKAVDALDDHGVECELNAAVRFAQQARTSRVLLSSEWLLPALAAPGRMEWLERFFQHAEAKSVKYFLFLRHPLDQCLSLYKHRAKAGTAGEIAEWVKHGYRLPEELAGFRRQAEAAGAAVEVRRYDRTPGVLEKIFFEDWLGVSVPKVDMPAVVNPSLTHSDLTLVRQMAEIRPVLVEPLYEALVIVDPAQKTQGEAMLAHARAVAAEAVSKHADEWRAWNELLPDGEELDIPESPAEVPPIPTELGMSERQMRAVCVLLAESAKPAFLARLFWRSRLRPALGRVKRTVWR